MPSPTIYDAALRDELNDYTHNLLMRLHKETGLDFNYLLTIAIPKRKCEQKIRKKNMLVRCNNFVKSGSCFCNEHSSNDKNEADFVGEYIIVNNREYLYHSLTNRVFTFDKSPACIGYLDELGESIIPL